MQIQNIQEPPSDLKISDRLLKVRNQSIDICEPLEVEDYVVQPITDVSPPKWHLAHTTWFFEAFVLSKYDADYQVFDPGYHFLFNSYYVSAGERWLRAERGNLTRPSVSRILDYRRYVDKYLSDFLNKSKLNEEILHVIEVGIQHEQQHQELLIYDIKYILGHNPTFPVYKPSGKNEQLSPKPQSWLKVEQGIYEIGHKEAGYCFDNEHGVHKHFLHDFEISSTLATNEEFFQFMEAGGYENHFLWLSEGWDWINEQKSKSPLYWLNEGGDWLYYTLGGLKKIDMRAPVSHISFYEADAFAKWKGCRLPTEFEWEVASRLYEPKISNNSNFIEKGVLEATATGEMDFLGNLWEWTSSPYRPYPFYKALEGALGEYNGKFMINQMVLRGGSYATPQDHVRHTYRNFFHPHLRWMCSGFRLAKHI
ncbi:MAG: ergothioneine biosynthesis protein EgtB [Cyclobacteriaceae bacterium]